MIQADTEREPDLDAMAQDFFRSPYASGQFPDWTIDRCLTAYLLRRGLGSVADNGTLCAALLDRIMANIALARTAP